MLDQETNSLQSPAIDAQSPGGAPFLFGFDAPPQLDVEVPDHAASEDATHWNCEVTKYYQLQHLLNISGGEGDGRGGEGSVEADGREAAAEGPGEDELGRFWELLDPETQPIMPIPGCPESQKIFDDHKEMARKYLVLQQEIYNLCQQKKELSDMVAEEKHKQQVRQTRYQDKILQLQRKREILRNNHSRLRAQLDKIQGREANLEVSNSSTAANPVSSSARHHHHYSPVQTPHRSSHYTSTHHLPSGMHQQQPTQPPPHPTVLPLQDMYQPRHLRLSPQHQQPSLASPSAGQIHASPLSSPPGGSLYPQPGPPRYHHQQQQQQYQQHLYHHHQQQQQQQQHQQHRHQYGSDLTYASPPD